MLQIPERDQAAHRREQAITRLGYRLEFAASMDMEPAKFARYLKHLKSRFMDDMRHAKAAMASSKTSSSMNSQVETGLLDSTDSSSTF